MEQGLRIRLPSTQYGNLPSPSKHKSRPSLLRRIAGRHGILVLLCGLTCAFSLVLLVLNLSSPEHRAQSAPKREARRVALVPRVANATAAAFSPIANVTAGAPALGNVSALRLRGVAPEHVATYERAQSGWRCVRLGSHAEATLPLAAINDDYCDCALRCLRG